MVAAAVVAGYMPDGQLSTVGAMRWCKSARADSSTHEQLAAPSALGRICRPSSPKRSRCDHAEMVVQP